MGAIYFPLRPARYSAARMPGRNKRNKSCENLVGFQICEFVECLPREVFDRKFLTVNFLLAEIVAVLASQIRSTVWTYLVLV